MPAAYNIMERRRQSEARGQPPSVVTRSVQISIKRRMQASANEGHDVTRKRQMTWTHTVLAIAMRRLTFLVKHEDFKISIPMIR